MGNQTTWANDCLWSLNSSINFLLLYSHFNCSSTIIFLNWEVTQLKVSQRTFSQCTQVHGKDESCIIPRYLMKDGRAPKAPKFKKQDQQQPSFFHLTIEIRINALWLLKTCLITQGPVRIVSYTAFSEHTLRTHAYFTFTWDENNI